MPTELKVIIKDEEKKALSDTFIIEGDFVWSIDDETIKVAVNKLIQEFKGIPEDIIIKATMVYK